MGVITVRAADDVWGASASTIRAIIDFAISIVGTREYLSHFRNQFEWGYNAIYVDELSDKDFLEFALLLKRYVDEEARYYANYKTSGLEILLRDLLKRVEEAKTLRGL
jgi:hypothetical protein